MNAEGTERTDASPLTDIRISIHTFLPSGRNVTLSISPAQTLMELRKMAKQTFGRGFLQLVSEGSILSPDLTISSSGLKDGDTLTAIFQTPHLVATQEAFALWAINGPVIAWGDPGAGGVCDCDQLTTVQQVVPADYAFAAILTDGHVVAWGDTESGSLCSDVQDELTNVKQLVATDAAFAALKTNGSVVTFGDENSGADSLLSSELLEMRSVVKLAASCGAFAAILANGRVFTWGKAEFGGNSRDVQHLLWNVTDIIGKRRNSSFTALSDGEVVATWGSSRCCASKEVQDRLKNVKSIDCTALAWAALLEDGNVVTWGHPCSGGVVCEDVQDRLNRNVSKIIATDAAFAALLDDGSVVSWGDPDYGGNDAEVRDQLTDVVQLHAGHNMFLALRKDGSIVRWGSSNAMSNWEHHGAHLEVEPHLKDLQDFCSTDQSFAASLTNGQVFAWGHPETGGSNRQLQKEIWKM